MIKFKINQEGSAKPQEKPKELPSIKPEVVKKQPRKLYRIIAVAWKNHKQVLNQYEPWLTTEYWARAWAEEMKEIHKKDKYIISVETYFDEEEILYYSNF